MKMRGQTLFLSCFFSSSFSFIFGRLVRRTSEGRTDATVVRWRVTTDGNFVASSDHKKPRRRRRHATQPVITTCVVPRDRTFTPLGRKSPSRLGFRIIYGVTV